MFLLRPRLSRRPIHTTTVRNHPTPLTNILAGDVPPPVQVNCVTPDGIELANGLVLPSACIFLDGKVFLWDVPISLWSGWSKDHFEVFQMVSPRPGKMFSYLNPFSNSLTQFRNRIVWHGCESCPSTAFYT